MKWINHMAIAGATTAVVAPPLVPIALLGSTAPDWLEWVAATLGKKVKHRTVTHYVAGWALGVLAFGLLWDFHHMGLAFFYGGLTHVLTDALTVTGVPFALRTEQRPAVSPVWGAATDWRSRGIWHCLGDCAGVRGRRNVAALGTGLVPVFL